MGRKQLNMTYALKDGQIVDIESVESGLKCGCTCPACGEPLVAKKGDVMMHHFAHYSGKECEYGYETSIHLAAKEILSKAKTITIPPVYIRFRNLNKKDELLSEEQEITIDNVKTENRVSNIVPDVIVTSGEREFFIEIYVTHKIDEAKLNKIRKCNISTIEINLSNLDSTISIEKLTNILLTNHPRKEWRYNSEKQKYIDMFKKCVDKKKILFRNNALRVEDCPINKRTRYGKSYALYEDNCLSCKYCISDNHKGFILCSGRHRIAGVSDFDVSEEERIKNSNIEIIRERNAALRNKLCPECGHALLDYNNKQGEFFRCVVRSCCFTVPKDSETGLPSLYTFKE